MTWGSEMCYVRDREVEGKRTSVEMEAMETV